MAEYANYAGYGLIFAGFVLLCTIKGNDPWRLSTLLAGLALVALASFSFGIFSDMTGLSGLLAQKIDEATHIQAQKVADFWVLVLPVMIGAIGANLITTWFLSKKPG